MSDLLLELFSEEIPARMQAQAAKDLERLVVGALSDRGLLFEGIKAFAGPRRLTLAVAGLPAKQPDVREEKKGPRVNAPAKAIEGFLRSAGVKLEDCETRDDGKGPFYVAVIDLKGKATADVIAELLPDCFAKLPWPKSMRWPQKTNAPVRWVRPLHSILCTLDGEVVSFSFAGVASGNTTRGHRFLSSGEIAIRRFEDYEKKLHAAHVILDAEQRKAIIFEGVKQAAFIHGLELIADEGLLNEVAGLAEWPVVLLGTIENQFMDVPAEILQTAMRVHQKYFALRDPATGAMANRFALVANMVAEDGGKQIVAGNERVLRARLSDAKFFWEQDKPTGLLMRTDYLIPIIFHNKLGTQKQRVDRITTLANTIALEISNEWPEERGEEAAMLVDQAWQAARLSKSDLTTTVVNEFPELQGIMGYHYALYQREPVEVAEAIRDHYKPLGPNDSVPTSLVTVSVAIADKLDQLVGFFAVDEKPTGSSDPFALRRAALGIIRLILSNAARFNMTALIRRAYLGYLSDAAEAWRLFGYDAAEEPTDYDPDSQLIARNAPASWIDEANTKFFVMYGRARDPYQGDDEIQFEGQNENGPYRWPLLRNLETDVLSFVVDRLKVALREKGTRHDLIDAVFSLGHEDDLVRLVARVEALQAFLKTDDGANLLAGYKRAANILKAEEKKDGQVYAGEVLESHLADPSEVALFAALSGARAAIDPKLAVEDFAGAMTVMASLRAPVDAFFEQVKVNADDAVVRTNRLNLLGALRATLHRIADFSKIEG